MRIIQKNDVGEKLTGLLDEEHPIDEDIGILDENGTVVGVVITKRAHEFFLKKVEEEEDRLDLESVKEFHESGEKEL